MPDPQSIASKIAGLFNQAETAKQPNYTGDAADSAPAPSPAAPAADGDSYSKRLKKALGIDKANPDTLF